MKNFILNIVVLFTTAFTFSEARNDGNIPSSACTDMIPGHGGTAQTVYSPYIVFTSYTSFYINGKKQRINLQGHYIEFKGFYCQARDEMTNTAVGQFEVVDMPYVQGHNCFSSKGLNDTISHSLQWSNNTLRDKSYLTVTWKAAFENSIKIRFRCTFVQNYSVFWLDVKSEVLTPMKNVTARECCNTESVKIGCMPLCRHASVKLVSADLSQARDILESLNNDDASCSRFYTMASLRCSYWSQYPTQNLSLEGLTGSSLGHDLKECCAAKNVSQECMALCDPDYYSDTSYRGDITSCFANNKDLSLCIIYPGAGTTPSESIVAASPTEFTTFSSSSTNLSRESTSISHHTTEVEIRNIDNGIFYVKLYLGPIVGIAAVIVVLTITVIVLSIIVHRRQKVEKTLENNTNYEPYIATGNNNEPNHAALNNRPPVPPPLNFERLPSNSADYDNSIPNEEPVTKVYYSTPYDSSEEASKQVSRNEYGGSRPVV